MAINAVSGQALAEYARQALGVQYVWGGNSLTSGVDCSGLVQQVFKKFGIELPRVTYDQIGVGAAVQRDKMNVGDLVFFDTDRSKSGPDHVGIYLGGGKFIHAPAPGKPVMISSITDSYYGNRLMGVRRVPNVDGRGDGSGVVDGLTFTDGGEEVRKSKTELAETYGMSLAFFNSVPELKRLLGQATANQWDGQLFQAHLKNTKWWKETSDPDRQAKIMAKQDPATYKATLEAARLQAQQAAVQMGATLSAGALSKLARNIVHFGWQGEHVQNFLGQFIEFNEKKVPGGQAGAAYQQLKQTAYDNGVSLSEQAIKTSAAYIVRGVSTMEKEMGNIRLQAAGKYPGYADQIMAGANMSDVASPYIQAMARELEVPSTDIDLYNPRISSALTQLNDKGVPSPMSLTDFEVALRSDPQWRRTQNAQDKVFATGEQVLKDMGLVAR